jgi:hypothetical protein
MSTPQDSPRKYKLRKRRIKQLAEWREKQLKAAAAAPKTV